MAKADQEIIEKYRARIKRQNETIKERYDRISATLPKGTIDRIKALGLTINGVANDAILSFLECAEEGEQTATEEPQNVKEAEHTETPEKPKAESLEDLQAILDAKRADIEAKKQEKEAHKEQKRAETIAAAKFAEK